MSADVSPRSRALPRFLTLSLARELGVLLALSLLFPFLIHVLPVPGDARLGPRLLPMFYAPLLAVLVGRLPTALLVALLAPWLNLALTGHPPAPMAAAMTVELTAFAIALRWLIARHGLRWWFAVPAFAASKLAMTALVALVIKGTPQSQPQIVVIKQGQSDAALQSLPADVLKALEAHQARAKENAQ